MTRFSLLTFVSAAAIAQTGASDGRAAEVNCTSAFTDPVPRGNIGMWITGTDYPSAALRNGEQGKVAVRFYVTAEGRIEEAEVVESSASPALQAATIAIVKRRARFIPATRKCVPVPGEYTGTFNWVLPSD